MPLTDPVPSLALDVLQRNCQDVDKFANQDSGTFQNRTGDVLTPLPVFNQQIIDKIAAIGFVRLEGVTFETGAIVPDNHSLLLWATADGGTGFYYYFSGEIPSGGKIVPPDSTPASTGGTGDGGWLVIDDLEARLAPADSSTPVGGVPVSRLAFDIRKYGAVADLAPSASSNVTAFTNAIAASRHVTAIDGVYYVNDTIELSGFSDIYLPACTIITTGMAGKPLFKVALDSTTAASEQISITMGGGSISGDAAYAFELVGVDTSPSTQETCRIVKFFGASVSSTSMRFVRCTNAAKSLFFAHIWHFGGSFLDTNGKVVETHITNSLIFGSGADTNGFLFESNGGSNQYSEGLHVSNSTIDGYENCFNIRDMFVFTLVSGYIGGSKSILFRPPTTTHNREFNIGDGFVFGGRVVLEDAVGGVSGDGKLSGMIFAGAVAPVIEVGTGWSNIDIENVKATSNGGAADNMIWVKNGCNDININGVNADATFNGGVLFTGANGANCRALDVNVKVGRAVTAERPVIVKNPSLDGVNDIDLSRHQARLPVDGSVPVGDSFGTVLVSLAKGQTGYIQVAGRVGGCAAGQTLLIDGISQLSVPEGSGWSSVYFELPEGESAFNHSIPFIAKQDIPGLTIGLTNSVGNTVAQNSAHAFIAVVKDL